MMQKMKKTTMKMTTKYPVKIFAVLDLDENPGFRSVTNLIDMIQ